MDGPDTSFFWGEGVRLQGLPDLLIYDFPPSVADQLDWGGLRISYFTLKYFLRASVFVSDPHVGGRESFIWGGGESGVNDWLIIDCGLVDSWFGFFIDDKIVNGLVFHSEYSLAQVTHVSNGALSLRTRFGSGE